MRDVLRSPLARVWVPVLTAAAGMATLDRRSDPGDLVYFVHGGEQLLSGAWAKTFADPMLQSGPLQLVVFGGVRNLAALNPPAGPKADDIVYSSDGQTFGYFIHPKCLNTYRNGEFIGNEAAARDY